MLLSIVLWFTDPDLPPYVLFDHCLIPIAKLTLWAPSVISGSSVILLPESSVFNEPVKAKGYDQCQVFQKNFTEYLLSSIWDRGFGWNGNRKWRNSFVQDHSTQSLQVSLSMGRKQPYQIWPVKTVKLCQTKEKKLYAQTSMEKKKLFCCWSCCESDKEWEG